MATPITAIATDRDGNGFSEDSDTSSGENDTVGDSTTIALPAWYRHDDGASSKN